MYEVIILGIENEIRSLLAQGVSPSDLIKHHHFKKSTVYKVYNEMKITETPVTATQWVVEDIQLDKARYQPGDNVSISYQLKNLSSMDLYVYRAGIELEWMHKNNTWYVYGNRFLLHPQESKWMRGEFDIPPDLPLGEYDLRFGIEGQFLSPISTGQITVNQTQWSTSLALEVKRPLAELKLFISHSTKNMSLVRSLSNYLDNQGIKPVIADDISSPGAYLPEKIQNYIDECDIFLALFTYEATRSKWVINETNYALSLNKPRILLKDESVNIETPYEWIPFSLNESVESLTAKVLNAAEVIKERLIKPIFLPFGGIILAGILAFIAGLAIGSRR